MKMINQLEIPIYLEAALPEITNDLKAEKKNNAYEVIKSLLDFMYQNIKVHNFNVVKRCFKVVDKLYNKGNRAVKNAIENVFVFSFTKMFLSFPAEKEQLLAIIPMTLYTIYIQQVSRGGC